MSLTLVSAAACGEDDKPPRNREQFCRSWAEAACSDDTVEYCQAEDVEACIDTQDDFCHDLVPREFSDTRGDECIEAVKDAYKDGTLDEDELAVVLRLGEPCNELIVGPGSRGEACMENSDCDASAGLTCLHKSDEEDGVCEEAEIVGGGSKCNAAQQTCDVGFYCNGNNCIASEDVDAECTIQEQCGEDGFCSDDGKCTAKLAVRSDCSADYQCNAGICYDGVCTSSIRLGRSEPLCDMLR